MKMFMPLAATAAALLANPSSAQSDIYYRATLATAVGKPTLVTRETVWRCADTACTAGRTGARDTVVCELVAKTAGRLASFSAKGTEFDADALAKCNARAK